jgi:Na+/melibiose symporter-like transporter
MLFLANIFFLIVKVTNQVSFYFVADLMFTTKYNVFIDVITFPGFLIAGIGVPWLVEKLGQKSDSRKFYRICCTAAIVIHLLFAALTFNGLVNKQPGTEVSLPVGILVVLFTGLAAIPLECKNLMQKEMEAETVDYVEWKTGTRVEGIMLSIMSFTGKIENSVSSAIGLAILGYTGYIAHSEGSMIQNAATNKALFFMTTLLPAIGYILMLVPMAFYNISGKDHHRMIEEIAERHAAEKTDEISENVEVKPEIK